MLTVACVLKSGGIYDATWVARLKAGVARHLPIERRFVCLSDVDVPCDRIPLEHDWPGWWSKIELFKLPGPVLYFDLDTAIVGDLTAAAEQAKWWPLITLRDFYRKDGLGSGVMAWNGEIDFLYHGFAAAPAAHMSAHRQGGDQSFIESTVNLDWIGRWQDICPGQFVSYKADGCDRIGIPPVARVISLHGRPKFDDMPATDAVRQAWEMAA